MTREEQEALRALQEAVRAALMDDHDMSDADRADWRAARRRWREDAVRAHIAWPGPTP